VLLLLYVEVESPAEVSTELWPGYFDAGLWREGEEVATAKAGRSDVLLVVVAEPEVGEAVFEGSENGGAHDGGVALDVVADDGGHGVDLDVGHVVADVVVAQELCA